MRKKLLLALLLATSAGYKANAQFHIGAKADANFFKITGEGIKPAFTPGIELGLYGTWKISEFFSLQPELLYTQNTSTKDGDFSAKYVNTNNPDGSRHIKLNYLSIPLLLRYNITPRFTIDAGPEFSYLFYSNESLLMYGKDAFKRPNAAVVGGVSYKVSKVTFFGRYVQGLTDINGIDDRYEWKTQQLQVGLGVDIK